MSVIMVGKDGRVRDSVRLALHGTVVYRHIHVRM